MNDPHPQSDAAEALAPAAPGTPLPYAEPGSLHALVLQSLDDDQAQEIVSIPLEGKSTIADHMVIASGRSTRQVAAMVRAGHPFAAASAMIDAADSDAAQEWVDEADDS